MDKVDLFTIGFFGLITIGLAILMIVDMLKVLG